MGNPLWASVSPIYKMELVTHLPPRAVIKVEYVNLCEVLKTNSACIHET